MLAQKQIYISWPTWMTLIFAVSTILTFQSGNQAQRNGGVTRPHQDCEELRQAPVPAIALDATQFKSQEQPNPTPTPRFQLLKRSQVGAGGVSSLASYQDYIVMSVHSELRLIDVTDRLNPTVFSSLDMGGYVNNIAVEGDYAFVVGAGYGLRVIDLATPGSLREVGSLPLRGPSIGSNLVRVIGTTAYIMESGYLRVIDITDVTHPSVMGETPQLTTTWDMDFTDGFVFVTTGDNLVIFDVRTPSQPQPVRSIPRVGWRTWHGITIYDKVAYVGAQGGGLVIFDVADPAQPRELSALTMPGQMRKPVVVNKVAYVPAGDAGLHIVDVSNLQAPKLLGTIDTAGDARLAIVAKNTVFLTDETIGLYIVDVSNPDSPQLLGRIENPVPPSNVKVVDDTLYALTAGRLLVYEISILSSPRLVGRLVLSEVEPTSGLAVVGTFAYVLLPANGILVVIDMNVVSDPRIVKRLSFGHLWGLITISQHRAYLGSSDFIVALDISNPANPYEVGRYVKQYVEPRSIVADETYAYVLGRAGPSPGLLILRVSDPKNITVVSELSDELFRFPRSIALSEGNIILGGETGVTFIDVTHPLKPTIRREVNFGTGFDFVSAVASNGDYAFAASSKAHLIRLYDVFHPDKPTIEGSYYGRGYDVTDIAIDGDVIALAAGYSGVIILEKVGDEIHSPTATPSPVPSLTTSPEPSLTPTPTLKPPHVYLPRLWRRR